MILLQVQPSECRIFTPSRTFYVLSPVPACIAIIELMAKIGIVSQDSNPEKSERHPSVPVDLEILFEPKTKRMVRIKRLCKSRGNIKTWEPGISAIM
jgi:hypothetical protein